MFSSKKIIFIILLAVLFPLANAQAVFTNPINNPPDNGNIYAPIYVQSSAGQSIGGGLNVSSGGLSSVITLGNAIQGTGVATGTKAVYGLSGATAVFGEQVGVDTGGFRAIYGKVASANDYAGLFEGIVNINTLLELSSGAGQGIRFFYQDTGISWPNDSDGGNPPYPDLFGIYVKSSNNALRLVGHGGGVEITDKALNVRLSVSEAGVVNVAAGGALKVNNVNVCLSDGTNCSALSSGAGWTDDGANVRLTTVTDKVGIGIATPGAKLEVSGGDLTTRNLKISSAIYPIIDFYSANADENNRNWRIAGVYNSYGKLEILSGTSSGADPTTTRLSIDKDGNVSVPTGEVRAKWLHSTAAGDNTFAGNVGIGTTVPVGKLDVQDVSLTVSHNNVAVDEATTNLVNNPDDGSVAGDAPVPSKKYYSFSSGYDVKDWSVTQTSASGKTFTYSIWMRSPGGTSTYLMYVYTGTGPDSGWYGFASGSLTSSWQRYSATRSDMGGTVQVVRIYRLNQIGTIELAGPQFEEKSSSTIFVDGTRNTGELRAFGNAVISGGIAAGGYSPSATHKMTTPTLYAEQAQIGDPAGGLKGAGNMNVSGLCIEGVCRTSWGAIEGSQDLLSVLNTGSDASVFTGNTTIGGGNLILSAGDKSFNARYNATENYQSTFNWEHLQLGNNGWNYLVAGNTAVGGGLKVIVNNTVNLSGIRAYGNHNGIESLSMDGNGNISAPSGEVRAKWLHSTAAGDNTFTGNVGIGTTAPSNRLTVRGATSELAVIGNTAAGVGTEHLLAFGDFGNYGVSIGAIQTVAAPNPQKFAFIVKTQGGTGAHTEKFRIDADGNVGIGTTNPAGKLEVKNMGVVYDAAIDEIADLGDASFLTNPDGKLTALVIRGADSIGAAIVSGREDIGSTWNTNLRFFTNNVTSGAQGTDAIQEKMRITGNGNVGIGTTGPGAKLEVRASSGRALRVYYDMDLYNTLVFTGSDWTEQGRISGSGFNMYVDSLGDVQLSMDTDNNSVNTFKIINGADAAVLTVDESGNGTFAGTLTVAGKISGVSTPTADTDAANKAYVDAAVGAAGSGGLYGEKHYFISSGTITGAAGGYAGLDAFCNSDASAMSGRAYHAYASGATGRGFKNGYIYSNKLYGSFALLGSQDPDLCRLGLSGNCNANWASNSSVYVWRTNDAMYCSNWQSSSPTENSVFNQIFKTTNVIPNLDTQFTASLCSTAQRVLCLENTGTVSAPVAPFLVDLSYTWEQARNYCISQGAHLAYIQSTGDNNYMQSLAAGNNVWIGLNDQASEGTFVWENGSAVPYTNWYSGQPNNEGGNEDCAELRSDWPPVGKWNDQNCSGAQKFICR